MKKKASKPSAFFDPRVFISFLLIFAASLLAISGLSIPAQGQSPGQQAIVARAEVLTVGRPDVIRMAGPFSEDRDLRSLPYVPPRMEQEEQRLMRHPLPMTPSTEPPDPIQKVREFIAATIAIPTPITTFDGMNSTQSGCGCLPPDTHGDVGPSHYIQSVNSSIKIFDKAGNTLSGPTTYNSFFAGLLASGTPCGLNQNDGDGIVFYDQLADRWVVSDFAFPNFPGVSFYP